MVKKCKECEHFRTYANSKEIGDCKISRKHGIPFILCNKEDLCHLQKSKLKCKDCKYWIEAEGTNREDDCGGCVFGGGYYPMFINEYCGLQEPYKSKVEKEHGITLSNVE